jgi:hypothetical protein
MHGGQTWKALVKNPFSVLQVAPVEFAVSWMKIVIQRENRSGRVVMDSLIYKAQERGISPAGVCFIGIGIAIGIERIKSTDATCSPNQTIDAFQVFNVIDINQGKSTLPFHRHWRSPQPDHDSKITPKNTSCPPQSPGVCQFRDTGPITG